MRVIKIVLALGLALSVSACQRTASPPQTGHAQEIAWREGDVDDGLAEAKESGKPVILYWGAKWCPPCNQMKSTLFKDANFIAETRNFVPVYLDGDTQGAQRWGEKFGISGYPTVIVLRPDGTEITRLSSAATAPQFADLLRVTAARTSSTEDLLARAQADPAKLSGEDWRLLANFDWRNDPKHFRDAALAGPLLDRLANAAPDDAQKRRFALLALVVTAEKGADGKFTLTPAQQARLTGILPTMLASPDEVTANRQELIGTGAELVAVLPPAQRDPIGRALIAGLDRLYADPSLSATDRLDTAFADIALAKAGGGTVSPAVLAKVRTRVDWADKSAKDLMARQAVISDAAGLLSEAGDPAGATKLLKAELKRSAQPYYYMLDLSSIAEDAGDSNAAIDWARQAYETAQGSATRVQWAIAWSNAVLRLTPADKAAVEASANAVIDELAKNPDSYYQRTRVKVTAWGQKLRDWSAGHDGTKLLGRLQTKMAGVCANQGPEAQTCGQWLRVA